MLNVQPGNIECDYLNWRGEMRHRRIEVRGLHWGTSEYYKEPGWLLDGVDIDRNVQRTYRLASMSNVVHL